MTAYNIPLLEPVTLIRTVQRLTTPEDLILLNSFPQVPYPYPTVEWDIFVGRRPVGKYNIPDGEANVRQQLGRKRGVASFLCYRSKKLFSPTALYYTRQAGSLAAERANEAILREVSDLNAELDNLMEQSLWGMLSGSLTANVRGVDVVVDYGMQATHKPTAATLWNSGSITVRKIVDDVTAWKNLIWNDARVRATTAYATETTMTDIFNTFATTGTASTGTNQPAGNLLSDRAKDAYYNTGILPGFLNLDWIPVEGVYDNDSGVQTKFLPDGKIAICNLSQNRPVEIAMGGTHDLKAPQGHTGKFAKTFQSEDPSGLAYLLECSWLPMLYMPDQIVYATTR